MVEQTYLVEEVAKLCNVTPWTVREWLKAGKLKGSQPGRSWLISESNLKQFLKERHGDA